jgi:hypothetical protein
MLLCTKTTEEIRAAGAGQTFRTYGHLRRDADGDVAEQARKEQAA